MKAFAVLLVFVAAPLAYGQDEAHLTEDQLLATVEAVNAAQNAVMRQGSDTSTVDDLFDLYTDDFVYEHEVYGGTYTRETLYQNTVNHLNRGGYTMTEDRYTILRRIPGRNAVAVERRENGGAIHLSVFEFRGAKVSRIVEYWE
ncbi:MAG: hypothetical protein Rubg2KO_37380 [Rubricoccaceae bacterium]